MRKYIAAAAVAVIATFAAIPGQAAVNTVVAVPGSALGGYATSIVVVNTAAPVNFVNLDATAFHNVVSKDKKGSTNQPLFTSGAAIGPGVAEIEGLESLPAGDYDFYCAPHAGSMTGTITIV